MVKFIIRQDARAAREPDKQRPEKAGCKDTPHDAAEGNPVEKKNKAHLQKQPVRARIPDHGNQKRKQKSPDKKLPDGMLIIKNHAQHKASEHRLPHKPEYISAQNIRPGRAGQDGLRQRENIGAGPFIDGGINLAGNVLPLRLQIRLIRQRLLNLGAQRTQLGLHRS